MRKIHGQTKPKFLVYYFSDTSPIELLLCENTTPLYVSYVNRVHGVVYTLATEIVKLHKQRKEVIFYNAS